MLKLYFNSYKGNDISFEDKLIILSKLEKEFKNSTIGPNYQNNYDITTIAKLNYYINCYNRKINSNFDLYYNYKDFVDYIKSRIKRKISINKRISSSYYHKKGKKTKEITTNKNSNDDNNYNIIDLLDKLTTKQLKELQDKLEIPDNFLKSWKFKLWKPSNKIKKQIIQMININDWITK